MQIFILFHIMYIETSLSNHSKGKETLYLSNPEARFFCLGRRSIYSPPPIGGIPMNLKTVRYYPSSLNRSLRTFESPAYRKKPISYEIGFTFQMVVPVGIEPTTQGFSVLCSTDWATGPFGCGGRIWTNDLRVMSPTSYQAALPRDV